MTGFGTILDSFWVDQVADWLDPAAPASPFPGPLVGSLPRRLAHVASPLASLLAGPLARPLVKGLGRDLPRISGHGIWLFLAGFKGFGLVFG